MRTGTIERKTAETDIAVCLCLDGTGKGTIDTGVGFLNHMLTLLTAHARFDLTVRCKGDGEVDDHHTVEDVGIVLGQAFSTALGDKRGICRYGGMLLPMDEALVQVALDLSGRSYLRNALSLPTEKIGTFDTELIEEFFMGFCRSAGVTLHITKLAGTNSHHIAEAAFKGVGRALRQAVAADTALGNEIPSTKGTLV